MNDVQLRNQIFYFEDVNLNVNKTKGLPGPTEDRDGVNKIYVDAEIAKLHKPETNVLKLDDSRAMTGNLNLNGNKIKSLAKPTEDEDGMNKKYVDDEISKLPKAETDVLKLDGSKGMTGNLNLNGNKIKNLAEPTEDEDDVNKKYVDNEISKLLKAETGVLKLDGSRAMIGNLDLNSNKIKNLAPAEDYGDVGNLKQVSDIYHPYVYELNSFTFYNGNNNPVNVHVRPDLPPDKVIRKHNHHVVYITIFFPGFDVRNGLVTYFHSFRNLNYGVFSYNKNVYLNEIYPSEGLT